MRNRFIIVMYHHVRKKKEKFFPRLNSLNFSKFKKQLNFLEKNYHIMNYQDLIDLFIKKKKFKRKLCLLTFDDGYLNHYTIVYPELKKRNIQGFFFPPAKAIIKRKLMDSNKAHLLLASNTSIEKLNDELEILFNKFELETKLNITYEKLEKKYKKPFGFDNAKTIFFKRMTQHVVPEKFRDKIFDRLLKKFVKRKEKELADNFYFNTNQAKEMVSNGMIFGNHCYNHLWLEKKNKKIQYLEIDKGLKFLKLIGAKNKNWLMCYPYGSYNAQTLNILKNKKCFLAFTSVNEPYNINAKSSLEIPRIDCNNVFEY